jgi:hypothetical protein
MVANSDMVTLHAGEDARLAPDRPWVEAILMLVGRSTLCLLLIKRSHAACALDLGGASSFACRRAKNSASSVAFGASLASANILYSEHHASETVFGQSNSLGTIVA